MVRREAVSCCISLAKASRNLGRCSAWVEDRSKGLWSQASHQVEKCRQKLVVKSDGHEEAESTNSQQAPEHKNNGWKRRLDTTMKSALVHMALLRAAVGGNHGAPIQVVSLSDQELSSSSAGLFRAQAQSWLDQDEVITFASSEVWKGLIDWDGVAGDLAEMASTLSLLRIQQNDAIQDHGSDTTGLLPLYSIKQEEQLILTTTAPWDSDSDSLPDDWQNPTPIIPFGDDEFNDEFIEPCMLLPPKIPSRNPFGSSPESVHYVSPTPSLSSQDLSSDDDLNDRSCESSTTHEIVPFRPLPTLFPYHISSGMSFNGRHHSDSTMSLSSGGTTKSRSNSEDDLFTVDLDYCHLGGKVKVD